MGSSHQGTTERNCAPSHLVVGNIKRHFLLELPWPPGQKHTHTALNRCSDCTLYYVPTYLSHLGPATKLWGRDDTLLTTTSQGGTQHAVDTQHTLCFFLWYIFILFPDKPLYSSFKTPSLLWRFLVWVPSRVSGSYCTYTVNFHYFVYLPYPLGCALPYSSLHPKQLAVTDMCPIITDLLNNQMSTWYFCLSNKLITIDI